MKLTYDLPFSELENLADQINRILDSMRDTERQARFSEDNIKEIVTSLSHDIRTPLTSLDGYFQLLSDSESEKERQHYIAVIQSRIKSLHGLLEEMFTFAKLQNENYKLVLSEVDITKVLHDAIFLFYGEFKSRGMEPELDLCEGRLRVRASSEGLQRIFQNIIKNALEHGDGDIGILLRDEDDAVVFTCYNAVLNPAEIDMTKVLTRFYKADAARTHSSTGLGLSIAKGLAERMGGEISAQLEQNIFSITLRLPK